MHYPAEVQGAEALQQQLDHAQDVLLRLNIAAQPEQVAASD
jgi:hypothetical protein